MSRTSPEDGASYKKCYALQIRDGQRGMKMNGRFRLRLDGNHQRQGDGNRTLKKDFKVVISWIIMVLTFFALFSWVFDLKADEVILVRDYKNIPEKFDEILAIGSESQINSLCSSYGCPYKWMNVITGYEVRHPDRKAMR